VQAHEDSDAKQTQRFTDIARESNQAAEPTPAEAASITVWEPHIRTLFSPAWMKPILKHGMAILATLTTGARLVLQQQRGAVG
jgi:hypothetical protein